MSEMRISPAVQWLGLLAVTAAAAAAIAAQLPDIRRYMKMRQM